jgi:hypothetical protein
MRRPDLPSFADEDFLAQCTAEVMVALAVDACEHRTPNLMASPSCPVRFNPRGEIKGARCDMIIMDDVTPSEGGRQ